jgi:hypothetical protein
VVSFDRFLLNGEALRFLSEFCPSPLFFNCQLGNQLLSVQWSSFRLWQLVNQEIEVFCKQNCAMASAGKRVFAQLTKRKAFIEAFYMVKTMDDNQRKF